MYYRSPENVKVLLQYFVETGIYFRAYFLERTGKFHPTDTVSGHDQPVISWKTPASLHFPLPISRKSLSSIQFIQSRWRIQGSRGGVNPGGGTKTYYLARFLPKTAWKWKKIGSRRGASVTPLDLPKVLNFRNCRHSILWWWSELSLLTWMFCRITNIRIFFVITVDSAKNRLYMIPVWPDLFDWYRWIKRGGLPICLLISCFLGNLVKNTPF